MATHVPESIVHVLLDLKPLLWQVWGGHLRLHLRVESDFTASRPE